MIRLICSLAMFCMSLFILVMFVGAILLALCLLDYLIDIDIKGKLVSKFGKRTKFKKIVNKVMSVFNKIDDISIQSDYEKKEMGMKFDEERAGSKMVSSDYIFHTLKTILNETDYIFMEDLLKDNPYEGNIKFAGFAQEKAEYAFSLLITTNLYEVNLIEEGKTGNYVLNYKLKS